MTPSELKILIVLGKSGSGKGTQVAILAKRHNLKIISSGALLRQRAEQDDFVGRRIAEILAQGGLIPTPVIFHMWLHELEVARDDKHISGIIFEGSPRKLYEALMLEETLWFYNLDVNTQVLYLDISDEEAVKRLLARGRADDTETAIRSRLAWFDAEVMPAVNFYKEKGKLIGVNGEQSIQDVEKEVREKTKEFFGK